MKEFNQTLFGSTQGDYFGSRMFQARTHAGIERKDAAESIGISVGQLGRIERGGVRMVSDPTTIVRAARLYGVSDVWLYGGSAASSKHVPDWYQVRARKSQRVAA
ncbi:helix-turn-helix domain-containing protein [Pseudoxanthomonas dokdonensis]|uniref:HTH cro/C1-type domain-containing protein n=1 Tax=Pseudoxanthomonas dokdonensis TaxID=344882 RepID=A0A0R0CGZ8_9GAMM|nr:helix-turn-helix transcriptional regulator [Pseudoxanthomonas dokdonensis]KRG69148.1 hypothetical protein ABB29_12150 [Pseudoxanthomonas dokdonensis]